MSRLFSEYELAGLFTVFANFKIKHCIFPQSDPAHFNWLTHMFHPHMGGGMIP
jgi:hypothetical protein